MRRKILLNIIIILLMVFLLTAFVVAQVGDQKVFLPIALRDTSSRLGKQITVCLREEPESLYIFGNSGYGQGQILQAIYDGPIDSNTYSYQPIIVDKIPSLQDGDITIEVVTVVQGDKIVDAEGSVVSLQPGVMIVPSGYMQPIEYSGGTVQLDQVTIYFTLKSGLVWSDGVPVTAYDSEYAFDLISHPDTIFGPKYAVERTESYEALDNLQIRWVGLPGNKDSDLKAKFFGPSPEHIWGVYTPSQLLTADVSNVKPIGWGPYRIDEWVKGDHIRLSRNLNYFRSSEGLPYFETLAFRFVGNDVQKNISTLTSGDCDILESGSIIDADLATLLNYEQQGLLKAVFSTSPVWEHLDFGIQHIDYDNGLDLGIDRPNFFGDVRTRHAIGYCVDRESIVNEVFFGKSIVINTYLPPEHPLYNPGIDQYEFDPAQGKELLAQVGWLDRDGDGILDANGVPGVINGTSFEIDLETTDHYWRKEATSRIAESLAQCGIQVNLKYYDKDVFYADGPDGKLFGRRFELAEYAWLSGIEPPCDLYMGTNTPGPRDGQWIPIMDPTAGPQLFTAGWAGTNTAGYFNPQYNISCTNGIYSIPGEQTYSISHSEAQRYFAQDLPVLPLFQGIKFAAARSGVNGLKLDPTENTDTWNIEEFSIFP